MKLLRKITVLLSLAVAPAAFCATITANSAVTYTDGTNILTLAAGDTLTIPDGSTFELVRGAITVDGTAQVDAGNGVAEVTGGSMFVEVKGDRARVSNTGNGEVKFTKPSGAETPVSSGSEIFSALGPVDTLVLVIETIGEGPDLPGFDVDPIPTGTPL